MKHFFLSGLIAVLLIPGTALAYLEPEDVLFQNGNAAEVDTSSSSSSKAAASVSSDDGLHGAAPEESGLTPREERILERVGRLQEANGTVSQPSGEEVLHSGAPLAHSGPESVFALAVLVIAIGTTLYFARTGRIDFTEK